MAQLGGPASCAVTQLGRHLDHLRVVGRAVTGVCPKQIALEWRYFLNSKEFIYFYGLQIFIL